jgi:hypothetical protein
MITPEPMKGLVLLGLPKGVVVWQTVAVVKLRQPAHPS